MTTERTFRKADQPSSALAAIERRVRIRLIDVSRKGCLLESAFQLAEGTVGMLEVEWAQDGTYQDLVRVERTQAMAGRGSLYRVGVEFIWTDAPGARSLRRLANNLPAGPVRTAAVVQVAGGSRG